MAYQYHLGWLRVFITLATLFSFQAFARSENQGKVYLIISVDWEGRNLSSANLEAIQEFRKEFPRYPLLHFLNAAYYTKPAANPQQITQKISSVIQPQDELGLHLHGWKSLFEEAGVKFKENAPTFWGKPVKNCSYDCGHEVSIHSYSIEELRKAIHLSREILNSHGFGYATSFRTGGWMGTENVLEAVRAEGLLVDSSAVPVRLLEEEIGTTPLYAWLSDLWKYTRSDSQPKRIKTAAGQLWEVPDNGALADYSHASDMIATFKTGVQVWKALHKNVYVHLGFHQETAGEYLGRVSEALRAIEELSERLGIPVEAPRYPLIEHLGGR